MKNIKSIFFMIRSVIKYTPIFFLFAMVEGIVWGFIHSITNVLFIKKIFDLIEQKASFNEIASLILFMAVFLLLAYIFNEWYWRYMEPLAKQKLHEKMQTVLYKKANDMDLECYDNADFYNDFIWALSEADSRAIRIVADLGKVLNRSLSSIIIVGVLFSIDILIVVVVCSSVLLTIFLKWIKSTQQFNYANSIKPSQRKMGYVERIFYLSDYAKEIRLSSVSDLLTKEYDQSISLINGQIRKYGKKFFVLGLSKDVFTSILFNIGIILMLSYKIIILKDITIGDFAASVSATWQLYWQLSDLTDYLPRFRENGLYARKYYNFVNLMPKIKDNITSVPFAEEFKTLELKNVSFTYPDSNDDSVSDVSMKISATEKIGIVGYNGAGKSTLIKLLLKLYEPTKGSISVNGNSLDTFKIDSYRAKFSVLFQDYQIYAASIAENIKMDTYTEKDSDNLLSATKESGVFDKIKSLENGINSQLKKEFYRNGVELSGGEYQKIALSRVFASDSDIIILDEPTSNIDPVSEYEINNSIMSSAFNKTVIIISHRLSTVRMADKIYMFEHGKIIEQGSHVDLMKLDGKYAEIFNMQAEKYRENYSDMGENKNDKI